MTRHRFVVIALEALLAAGLVSVGLGCGKSNPAGPSAQSAADRAAIEKAIGMAPELADNFADDGGELLGTAEPATPIASTSGSLLAPSDTGIAATAPIHWGRRRIPPDHPPTRTIEFLVPPDSGRAVVRIVTKFDGWFYVDRTDDGLRNPGKKPLREKMIRYALFRKVWFRADSTSPDSVFGWRLAAVSPAVFSLIDAARQTVQIQSVHIAGARLNVTITDPTLLLGLRRPPNLLPIVRQGEVITVEAKVTNSEADFRPSEFVYLHVPSNDRAFAGPFDRVRIRMNDGGRDGDATAGDGVYTARWEVQDIGRHHFTVDVLNARTLQNEDQDDYNSASWGVPYSAYPSILQ